MPSTEMKCPNTTPSLIIIRVSFLHGSTQKIRVSFLHDMHDIHTNRRIEYGASDQSKIIQLEWRYANEEVAAQRRVSIRVCSTHIQS